MKNQNHVTKFIIIIKLGSQTGPVLTRLPLIVATSVRYWASACEMVMWSPSRIGCRVSYHLFRNWCKKKRQVKTLF